LKCFSTETGIWYLLNRYLFNYGRTMRFRLAKSIRGLEARVKLVCHRHHCVGPWVPTDPSIQSPRSWRLWFNLYTKNFKSPRWLSL
jgi:hypothetical protein